jgi:hypothetical protein
VRRALVTLVLLAACSGGETLDTTGLPSAENYQTWRLYVWKGQVPGHGDSWRYVYVNDVGRTYGGGGTYTPGTVLVKEVREPREGGALRSVDIMRKLGADQAEHDVDQGWLFSTRSGDDETAHGGSCWQTCHQVAPLDGTFFDYGD